MRAILKPHALYCGARRKIISRELALAAVRVMRASCSYREFYRRLLTELDGLYPETEILEALCAMLIRETAGRQPVLNGIAGR